MGFSLLAIMPVEPLPRPWSAILLSRHIAMAPQRLFEDVRAERHLRQLALLEKLRAERQRLESTAATLEEVAEDVERA